MKPSIRYKPISLRRDERFLQVFKKAHYSQQQAQSSQSQENGEKGVGYGIELFQSVVCGGNSYSIFPVTNKERNRTNPNAGNRSIGINFAPTLCAKQNLTRAASLDNIPKTFRMTTESF